MTIIEFLFFISMGLLGFNTVALAIIYSILPLHITKDRWSAFPIEIAKINKLFFGFIFGSLLFEGLYILNEQWILPLSERYRGLQYIFLVGSILFIAFTMILSYKMINMIRQDVIDRSNEVVDLLFYGASRAELKELFEKYGLINTKTKGDTFEGHISLYQIKAIIDELRYLEKEKGQPISLLQLCEALSYIYGGRVPVQRIQEHFEVEPKELDMLLSYLEKKEFIKIESNVVILEKGKK